MPTILYVSHSSQIGGAEQSLLELLRRVGTQYAVAVACPPGPLVDRLKASGVRAAVAPVARLRRTASPLMLWRSFRAWRHGVDEVARIVKETDARIVHSNSTTAHLFGGAAAKRCRVASVWHVRDAAVPRIARPFLHDADARIAISRFVAGRFERSMHLPCEVIYNGVDVERFRPADAPPARPVVLMVGQIVPWKRHEDFIRAAAAVLRAIPEATFRIAGADLFNEHAAYRARLEKLAATLALGKSLSFEGYRDDVPELLRYSSLLVLPSRREPFGRVVVEAMACGLPVIATDDGGPAEIVVNGESGVLVRPGHHSKLATAIINTLVNPENARRMGESGRRRAVGIFDAANSARKVMDLYAKLLEGRP